MSGLAWLCVRLNDQSPEKNSQVNLVSLLDVFFFLRSLRRFSSVPPSLRCQRFAVSVFPTFAFSVLSCVHTQIPKNYVYEHFSWSSLVGTGEGMLQPLRRNVKHRMWRESRNSAVSLGQRVQSSKYSEYCSLAHRT